MQRTTETTNDHTNIIIQFWVLFKRLSMSQKKMESWRFNRDLSASAERKYIHLEYGDLAFRYYANLVKKATGYGCFSSISTGNRLTKIESFFNVLNMLNNLMRADISCRSCLYVVCADVWELHNNSRCIDIFALLNYLLRE